MQKIKSFIQNNEYFIFGLILLVFVIIRLPGLDIPYHQDEYKWPLYAYQIGYEPGSVPHPPLTEFLYTHLGTFVGIDNFRFIPFIFSIFNLTLLYYFVRFKYGKSEAIISSIIMTVSYFSVLSSLMVDTDGAILPFFFLLSLIGYFKIKDSISFSSLLVKENILWTTIFIIGVIGGFMVKVSFMLYILAISMDFLWSKKDSLNKQKILFYLFYLLVFICFLIGLLLIAKFIFPSFNLDKALVYWKHFIAFSGRGWFQTAIQCIKAIIYTSPFLILLPLLSLKEVWNKSKLFIFFLLFSFIFYIILFDFSVGALDRYLSLLVVPLTIMSTLSITCIFREFKDDIIKMFLLGIIIALCGVYLQFLPHFVPPLHPKSEWIHRFINLRWNFLYPFSGGSGPLGFYISFLFIMYFWLISVVVYIITIFKSHYKKLLLFFIIPLSLVYNLVFIEEYLFGKINGNAASLVHDAVLFIKTNSEIKKVTVYNDNGGFDVFQTGKYRKRLYIDPKFDIIDKVKTLNTYKEHYLVINIPRIDSSTVYQKYFDSCKIIYNKKSGKISAIIYDCQNIPDIKI